MPVVSASQLRELSFEVFERMGVPPEAAEIVSNYIVDSHLYGHDTHGVISLPRFVEDIRVGKIIPEAQIEVVRRGPATALVDGNRGFGYVTATEAMEIAIDVARSQGVSAVGVTNCNHIGMLWGYAKMAVDQGLIGVVVCSAGPQGGLVVPYGGTQRFLGANPLAFGLPAGEVRPLIMDTSTSVVAGGRVLLAREKGESIPEGWMVDKDGHPTTNPDDLWDEEDIGRIAGALLPFGAYKGYGLALLIEMLGGILTGYGPAYLPDYQEGNGTFMIAIDVNRFVPLEEFRRQADELFREIKKVPTDAQTSEILIPGELEFRAKELREREGIPIPEKIWKRVAEVAAGLGIAVEDLVVSEERK